MDDYQLQLKQEYTDINITKEQQNEDYYWNKSEYDQKAETEAEDFAINQTEHEQRIKEAEKVAGLGQKKLPEQEVPADVMKQMEAEYASIHKGKKLSGKARSKVKKEYLRKQRQSESARKIVAAHSTATYNMKDFVTEQTSKVTGKNRLDGNDRKNGYAVAYSTMMNGQSMVGATYSMRSLSINLEKASDEECDKKALESERIFKVIMDYDLKKLKYSNSDEFLKNLGEKLTIVSLASECDNLVTDYRTMRERGKIKNPLSDKFLNEIDARVKTLTTISSRVIKKANIMSSPLYSVISEDSIKDLSNKELENRIKQYYTAAATAATEEQRKQANEYAEYYTSILALRGMDASKDKIDRFGRGTDPEKLLELNRKAVNKKYPPAADEQEATNWVNLPFNEHYRRVVEDHIMDRKNKQGSLSFHGEGQAVDYANFATATNMEFLKDNPSLRRREIKRYYAMMHGGKKIPKDILEKIEGNFQRKFEDAEKLSQANSIVGEFNVQQTKRVGDFFDAHRDENGKLTITDDRGANHYLLLLDNKTMEEKEQCYQSFVAVKNVSNQLSEGKKAKLSPEDEIKQKEQIEKGTKPLVDFVNNFDVKKLEFTNPSELIGQYNEVNTFFLVVQELQNFPSVFKHLGILDEKNWIEFQARIIMAHDLSAIVKNMMAMRSSSVYSLLDEDDLDTFREAILIMPGDKEAMDESPIPNEIIKDMQACASKNAGVDGMPELAQILKGDIFFKGMLQRSYYKPGGSMVDAMEEYKADAKKEWDSK